jgi:Fe-S-cluster containining protein
MLRRRRLSLDDVYRQIPPVDCRGQCLESCGPISMSRQEQGKLLAQGINIPPMAEAIAALEKGEDYYCPALIEGRCSVYDDRPTICRLWGATESMPCAYGCTPDDALTQEESYRLLRLAAEVGGGMVERFTPTDS